MGRRNRLDIVFDILKLCEEGALKTQIMYQANLSYAQLQKYLEVLQRIEFITKKKIKKKRLYFATSYGSNYLQKYPEIQVLSNKIAEMFEETDSEKGIEND